MAGALLGFWSECGRCYEPQHHRQDFANSLNGEGVVTCTLLGLCVARAGRYYGPQQHWQAVAMAPGWGGGALG